MRSILAYKFKNRIMHKKNTFFSYSILSFLTCLLFVTTVHAQSPCTSTSITSFLPASGPVGTVVTISGTGFQLGSGTSSVKFNGVEAPGFTVVSASVIKATVPSAATTGTITIITNGCRATGTSFTVLASNCTTSTAEIYISEVYDQVNLSPGAIELYNPSNATIFFNGMYKLERYGHIADNVPDNGPANNLILTGSIGPEQTYLIQAGDIGEATCLQNYTFNFMGMSGINDDDKFRLKKNDITIDEVQVPFGIGIGAASRGYTLIRRPDAVAPKVIYNINDWNNSNTESCNDLGDHTADPGTPGTTINTQPADANICVNGQATFTVTLSSATGFTYQWKTLNTSGAWVNVTNGTNYSGATTATLTVNNASNIFNGYQYYCVMTSTACTLVSEAAQLNVTDLPALDAEVSATDCATGLATITVRAPLGAGITYTLGTNTYNTPTFTATPGPYNLIATSGTCTVSGPIVVGPVSPLAAIDAEVSATDCATGLATITVRAPLGAGITYTIGTNTYNTPTFTAAPGPYNLIATSGTCTVSGPVVVLPITNLPQITGLQECRETVFGRNYILEALPLSNSFDVATSTFEWRRNGQTAIVGDDTTFNVGQYAIANSLKSTDFPLQFELTVRTPGGCEATHVYNVEGVFCDIPRGISPNNDAINDNFDLTGLDVKKLTIFNRYGLEVYNKGNYKGEWYGQTNNGDELPTGTYFYVVELEGNSRTGWVYINRAEN